MQTKRPYSSGGWLRGAARRLALLIGLPVLLSGCELTEDVVGDVPTATVTGTVYIDTLTVRMSTVLIDSVPTSSSSYLLVGQYQDARLGTITARSYLRLGLAGGFTPEAGAQFDSLVLVLPTDSYCYGDTTQVQHLQVHRLTEALRPTTTYYAFNSRAYEAVPLATRTFRARPNLRSIRLRLADALGQELLQAGLSRQLSSTDELAERLPGLALTPAAADNGALLRLAATSESMVLQLFYHYPSAPDNGQVFDFTAVAGSRHFYQVQADRRSTLLSTLTTTRQALSSTRTAAETYIEGALGLQTKLEIPYLLNLNELGGTWVLNAATLTLETVAGSENRLLPAPATLTAQATNRGNQSGAFLASVAGTQLLGTYQTGVSAHTNLEQGSYTLLLQQYAEAVLKHTVSNTGILLAPASPDTPERVVLGAAGSSNPPRLGIYLTRVR
ncbi:DUF4270 family protein [Hymenobacter perfusus]|nr:DUF4270 family protein [Hymenobacter perfusus]